MIGSTLDTTTSSVSASAAQFNAVQPLGTSSPSSSAVTSASDSVQLSPTAQATALYQQGLTVKAIATDMGLTTAEVDSYLAITTSISTGVPTVGHSAPIVAAQSAPVSKAAAAGA